jgi:hypothetical protein
MIGRKLYKVEKGRSYGCADVKQGGRRRQAAISEFGTKRTYDWWRKSDSARKVPNKKIMIIPRSDTTQQTKVI